MVIYVASGEPSTASGSPSSATICNSAANPGALRVSTDGGATWSLKLQGGGGFCAGQCFYNIAVAVDPINADRVYLGSAHSTGVRVVCFESVERRRPKPLRRNASTIHPCASGSLPTW